MTEHLPECLVPDFDKGLWICICNQLRACEQRVFALHPEWTMTGLCKPDCSACRRLTELITEWEDGYEKGLDAAREAVEAAGHKRFGVYYECECPDEVREQDGHVIELQDFYGCEKSLLYFVCRYCCSENDYHSEHCASGHDHGPDKPYCTAVAAIDELREKQ